MAFTQSSFRSEVWQADRIVACYHRTRSALRPINTEHGTYDHQGTHVIISAKAVVGDMVVNANGVNFFALCNKKRIL